MNASHVRLADDYEFSCGETYSDGIITPCNLPGKLRTHIVKSRFVGLLAKVDTSEGNGTENWAGRGIEEYLENKLGSYVHKCGTVRDIVSPKFGQLVHKYLSQIFQKKSLFDMMDFEMILRYDCWIGDENCDFWLD
ncbi:uncharacterized protein LOC118434042 [Folsomia candida]|uniref:uncharacterized protein LOC118434042 n=1 Tax=Folsomia candida TaxID=158441 RepID=UPI001604A2EF|nr:uncharacterized protein LOC118434042 [Folsomia candida]